MQFAILDRSSLQKKSIGATIHRSVAATSPPEGSPAGLMAGADAGAGIAVEVLRAAYVSYIAEVEIMGDLAVPELTEEEAEFKAEIEKLFVEIERTYEQIQRHREDFERSRSRTLAVLAELRAA